MRRLNSRAWIGAALLVIAAGIAALHSARAADSAQSTLFGTSTFPYAKSAEAIERTFRLASELSEIYVVQLDEGVPWREALAQERFPDEVMVKWKDLQSHAPPGRPMYLALQPLAEDRVSLAPASAGSSVPRQLRGAAFDDPALTGAYLAYAERAVRFFHPSFLNLGVENGELAHRSPGNWPGYERMVRHVMDQLHADFPGLRIGISFGLQSLMTQATAERAQGLIEASDYVGLSFYPYMSAFQEKFGTVPLPPPPDQWRKPLEWIRAFTRKPLALCETGYNTADVALPRWHIRLSGSAALQAQYVEDLGRIAARDGYLFVIYYLPVDIGALLETLPEEARAEGSMWSGNGLFDGALSPKPALAAWRALLDGQYRPPPQEPPTTYGATAVANAPERASAPRLTLGFSDPDELCQAPPPAHVQLVPTDDGGRAMLWAFQPRPGSWAWCARGFAAGSFPAGKGMRFRIRSNVASRVILEAKAADGSGYYAAVSVGSDWHEVTLNWRDFQGEEKNSAVPIDPARIVKIVLANEGEAERGGADGLRQVWLADWIVR